MFNLVQALKGLSCKYTSLKREIKITKDGSTTIYLPEWKEQYHSINGAIQEAKHVFLKMGLHYFAEKYPDNLPVNILEVGFGTGLNTLLTLIAADAEKLSVKYKALEAYPVSSEEILKMNYILKINKPDYDGLFGKLHQDDWEIERQYSPYFWLKKECCFFQDFTETKTMDLIYFDAFSAQVQPELWSENMFAKMYQALRKPGILVTYAANGKAKRALTAAGFAIEKLPGPPGKREMLRATKE